jgi:hypothetical protein
LLQLLLLFLLLLPALLFQLFPGFPFPFQTLLLLLLRLFVLPGLSWRILFCRFGGLLFFRCFSGGAVEQPGCPKTIDKRYPEYDRHGLSAGSKFTIRYAKNVTIKNSDITLANPDVRPDVAYFDYED